MGTCHLGGSVLLGVSMSRTFPARRVGEPANSRAGTDFDDFVVGVSRELRQLCWALTGDQGLGEDLAQVTLIKVWRSWRRIEGDPCAYAKKIAVNESISWKRRRAWHAEVVSEETDGDGAVGLARDVPGSPGAAELSSTRIDIERWLAALAPQYRAVIVLRFLLDLSVEDTAAVLGASTGTVKSRTSRALDKIRGGLKQSGRDGSPNDQEEQK